VNQGSRFIHAFGESIGIELVDELHRMLVPVFSNPAISMMVCDMGNVRVCDSSGLRFLLSLQRKANETGKRLIIYRPQTMFRQLLEHTNLIQVFSVHESLENL
jgi:anti-anti-sigma factor